MKSVLIIFTLLLVGCGEVFDFNKKPLKVTQNQGPQNVTTKITFQEIQEKVLGPSCLECHPGYSDYQTVKNKARSIQASIQSNRMPKEAPALDDNLKQLVSEWVNGGAPLGTPGGSDGVVELKPNWASLSKKIFFPKCVMCHNPRGEASILDMSDRQKFFDNRVVLLNNFENPETSYLIEVISDPDEPMPPDYSGIDRLSNEEIQTIIEWIRLGLP